MTKSAPRIFFACVAGWTMISPIMAFAGDTDKAASLYSRGVHAYFAGRPGEAESLLSRALAIESTDPRLYYFRALSRLRLGRRDLARMDMQTGANLEAQRLNRYAMGAVLQRVQGADRLLLEQVRSRARDEAAMAGIRRSRLQNEQIAEHDSDVLRQQVVVPLDELLRPGGPRSLTPEELTRRAVAPPTTAATAPMTGESPPADPFRDDALPSTAETPTPSVPAESPATETPSDDDEDPFSDFTN